MSLVFQKSLIYKTHGVTPKDSHLDNQGKQGGGVKSIQKMRISQAKVFKEFVRQVSGSLLDTSILYTPKKCLFPCLLFLCYAEGTYCLKIYYATQKSCCGQCLMIQKKGRTQGNKQHVQFRSISQASSDQDRQENILVYYCFAVPLVINKYDRIYKTPNIYKGSEMYLNMNLKERYF